MADNYFINELGINVFTKNMTDQGYDRNEFTSQSITIYYRIRRSQVLWEYTNPDIKINIRFFDNSNYNTGWLTKQGDAGRYSYEGDDGIGRHTIVLPSNYLKPIQSITLYAKKSSNSGTAAEFSKTFNFINNSSGATFYKSIYFSGTSVAHGTQLSLVSGLVHPQYKTLYTTGEIPSICGYDYTNSGNTSSIYFGDGVGIENITTLTYSTYGATTPNRIKVYMCENNGQDAFELVRTLNQSSVYLRYNCITIPEKFRKKKIKVKAIYSIGYNDASGNYVVVGEYTRIVALTSMENISDFLDFSKLKISPNKILGENLNNDLMPYSMILSIEGEIQKKASITTLPFDIKKVKCELKQTINSLEDKASLSVEPVFLDDKYIVNAQGDYTPINAPEQIILSLQISSQFYNSSTTSKTFEYEYTGEVVQEPCVVSSRSFKYTINNIYNNVSFNKQDNPILLQDETINFIYDKAKIIFNPNDRSWDQNGQIVFQVSSETVENNSFKLDRQIKETDFRTITAYATIDDKKIYAPEEFTLQLGRKMPIEIDNSSYIQNNTLHYILLDNGGDQNKTTSSASFLDKSQNSLFRGKNQDLIITFYKGTIADKTLTISITPDNIVQYFKENQKKTQSLGTNFTIDKGWTGLSFYYNDIRSEIFPLKINAERPTLSFRKNGLIINGTKGEQLSDDTVVDINAFGKKKIKFNILNEENLSQTINSCNIEYQDGTEEGSQGAGFYFDGVNLQTLKNTTTENTQTIATILQALESQKLLIKSGSKDYKIYQAAITPDKNVTGSDSISITMDETIPDNAIIRTLLYTTRKTGVVGQFDVTKGTVTKNGNTFTIPYSYIYDCYAFTNDTSDGGGWVTVVAYVIIAFNSIT